MSNIPKAHGPELWNTLKLAYVLNEKFEKLATSAPLE